MSEKNPGPGHLEWGNPSMCSFLRICIINVVEGQNINDCKDQNQISFEKGVIDAQILYGKYFSITNKDWDCVKKNQKKYYDSVKAWAKAGSEKETRRNYFETFSARKWKALDEDQKLKHSILCAECEINFLKIHSSFPCKSKRFSKESKRLLELLKEKNKSPVDTLLEEVQPMIEEAVQVGLSKLKQANGKYLSKKAINTFTSGLTESMNKAYDASNIDGNESSFTDSFVQIRGLQPKISPKDKADRKKEVMQDTVTKINETLNKHCTNQLYGGNSSMKEWDRRIMMESFETVPEAQKRTIENKEKIKNGVKKKKNHIGPESSYVVDKFSEMKEEMASWDDNYQPNWKAFGTRYFAKKKDGLTPANPGQVAKELILIWDMEGKIEVDFKGKGEESDRVRRKQLKLNYRVSVPKKKNSDQTKIQMLEEVKCGIIDIGEPVCARQCSKLTVDKTGEIIEKVSVVEGRKHPLGKIRKRLLHKNMQYMRLDTDEFFNDLRDDELYTRCKSMGLNEERIECMSVDERKDYVKTMQRTRHLKMWHDASGIENHGHILFCASILYDSEVFYTDSEYWEKFGKKVCVQKKVEAPEMYIVGRCKNNDEQLAYISTRLACLDSLKIGLKVKPHDKHDMIINDIMRFFAGDGPSAAMESGNQKGGHYFCCSCGTHISSTHDISYTFQQKHRSFKDRAEHVLKGSFGKQRSSQLDTQPFDRMTVPQLIRELDSRNVDIEGFKKTKKDLEPLLKQTLQGIKRLPILLIKNPLASIDALGLSKYEIVMLECMHDIAGHIDNVVTELPHHVKDPNDKEMIKNLVDALKNEKTLLRCCDKRRILLILCRKLQYKVDGNVFKLLATLAEIQRILYLPDDSRTAKTILRLHNSCFEHFVLMKQVFNLSNLSSGMSRDKLFGKYFHDLMSHGPIQYRIVSGLSISCEDEERLFNELKTLTVGKTSHRDGHAIGNMVVRCEYAKNNTELFEYEKTYNSCMNDIRRLGKTVEQQTTNSLFPYNFIKNNSADWQSHLERISDFLVIECAWWQKTPLGIEFFDVEAPNSIQQPKVHHFRSASIKDVIHDLKSHWNEIVDSKKCIPLHELWTGGENEPARVTKTQFLENAFGPSTSVATLPLVSDQLHDNLRHNDTDEIQLTGQEILDDDLDGINDILPSNHSRNFSPINQSIAVEPIAVEPIAVKPTAVEPIHVEPMLEPLQAMADVHTILTPVESVDDEPMNSGPADAPKVTLDFQPVSVYQQRSVEISLNTREARDIYQVLGNFSQALLKFDRKKSAKASPLVTEDDILECRAPLETMTLKKVRELKEEYQQWERSFMLENDLAAPTGSELDPMSDKYGRIKKGEQLLRKWQIFFD